MTIPFPKDWLLAADEPWTRFQTRVLLGENADRERKQSVKHPFVQKLLKESSSWPKGTEGGHQSAKDVLNKLTVLADLGVRRGDPGVDALKEKLLKGLADDHLLRSPVLMPRAPRTERLFDIDGQDPLIAVAALGYSDDRKLEDALNSLLGLRKADGGFAWPNAKSPLPCRKDEGGCPYPTLKILRLLALVPKVGTEKVARTSTNLLLDLWSKRASQRRYGFGMGDAFSKLKYPFIWFDVLHVAEALSQFRWVWSDARFQEIVNVVVGKADVDGRFVPESVWMEWKGQCFAQKKAPSPWLTVIVHRMLARAPSR